MTVTGTNYDHLTLEEIDHQLGTGEISILDLPNELVSAWAAWEPDPADLTGYALSDPAQREEFLYQYCYQGEPVLLVAVAHIWDSLAEPREARCIQIGLASGGGGKGQDGPGPDASEDACRVQCDRRGASREGGI